MSEEGEVRIVTQDGRVITGKKLKFKPIKEDWNVYELEDGSKLYVKLVLIDVVRRDEFSPIGEPVYQIMSQNVTKVMASKKSIEEVEERMKKKKGKEVV